MQNSNMDLSHLPVPAAEWALRTPAWSTPYTSNGVSGGVSLPAFEVPVSAITPRSEASGPSASTTGSGISATAKAFASQKLIAGAIGLGLVLGMSALVLVTGATNDSDPMPKVADRAMVTPATQAAGVATPTQAVAPKKPTTPTIEARFRSQWEPTSPATPALPAPAEAPAEPHRGHHRLADKHEKKIVPTKHVETKIVATPTPPSKPPKPKPADFDVAQAQAILAQSSDVTTLK